MYDETAGQAAWHSVFYAVSAFNNAGFVPTTYGLDPFASDWWVLLPIIVGVFIGSLGFPVILNVARHLREPRRWSLHSKLTITTSIALVIFGALLIGPLEWRNPATFGALDLNGKSLASLFAGVMPRSGGFSTVDVHDMHESTWLVTDALMFVGGGSASTAGGIKVTTLAVMLLAILAEGRGDKDVEAYGRRIPREALQVAIAVTMVSATFVLVASLLLLTITDQSLDQVLFIVISAFATCGLSTGLRAAVAGEVRARRAHVHRPDWHDDACGSARAAQPSSGDPATGREADHWLTDSVTSPRGPRTHRARPRRTRGCS